MKQKYKLKKEQGITLIALIITIIILVILAAISISAAYESGIIGIAVNGAGNYANEAKRENEIMSNTESLISSVVASLEEKTQGSGNENAGGGSESTGGEGSSGSESPENKPEITEADVRYIKSETNWTNQNVITTVEINKEIDITGYEIQYTTFSEGEEVTTEKLTGATWNTYPSSGITSEQNETIYTRLYDGTNTTTYTSTQISNIDKTDPSTASLTAGTATTNEIQVTATGADSASGVASYTFQISTTNEASEFTTVGEPYLSTEGSCSYTYTGLTDNTTYYLKVIVTDVAGNTTESTIVTNSTLSANTAPTFTTQGYASSRSTNSITVGATATDNEGDNLTYILYWGTTADNLTESTSTTGSSGSEITFNNTGLGNYTTYYFRVDASDGKETVQGIVNSAMTYCATTYCRGYSTTTITCTNSSCSNGNVTVDCTVTSCDQGSVESECPGYWTYRFETISFR